MPRRRPLSRAARATEPGADHARARDAWGGRPEVEAPREPSRRRGWILAGTLGAAALIAAAGFAGATIFGDDGSSSGGQGASEERHFTARGRRPAGGAVPVGAASRLLRNGLRPAPRDPLPAAARQQEGQDRRRDRVGFAARARRREAARARGWRCWPPSWRTAQVGWIRDSDARRGSTASAGRSTSTCPSGACSSARTDAPCAE